MNRIGMYRIRMGKRETGRGGMVMTSSVHHKTIHTTLFAREMTKRSPPICLSVCLSTVHYRLSSVFSSCFAKQAATSFELDCITDHAVILLV